MAGAVSWSNGMRRRDPPLTSATLCKRFSRAVGYTPLHPSARQRCSYEGCNLWKVRAVHVRTNFRTRRGDRKFSEAVAATGINKGVLSRIERGEQLPKDGQFAAIGDFYCPEWFAIAVYGSDPDFRDPAAAASLGLEAHALSPAVAAALVLAGCLTVLPASIGTRRLADVLATPAAGGVGPGAAAVEHAQEVPA